MNFLQHLDENLYLNRLQGATDEVVKNGFFANYLAALVLLKLQDLKGLLLINDPSHAKLGRFSQQMSDVNFWGRALFFSKDPEVKNRLLNGHADVLAHDAQRVVGSRIIKTMNVPLTAPDHIDWNDTIASLILYRNRFDVRSSYFVKIVRALMKWDALNDAAKRRTVSDSFMYLMQSDPKSALLSRMRQLSNSLMINSIDSLVGRMVGFKKLHEDEGGAVSTGEVASGDAPINMIVNPFTNTQCDNGGAAPPQPLYSTKGMVKRKAGSYLIRDGRIIKKKVKSFKARKFKAPDFMKTLPQEDQV